MVGGRVDGEHEVPAHFVAFVDQLEEIKDQRSKIRNQKAEIKTVRKKTYIVASDDAHDLH